MADPASILSWLQKEMGYPLPPPSPDQLRKICRGNMLPLWTFLLHRVRSDRTVTTLRRNMLVHGVGGEEETRGGFAEEREEVERLRNVAARQRKELKARMAEIAREEADRNKLLSDRSATRHKHVMLEAYDQQCDEAAKIFAEYERRLHRFVDQAREVRRSTTATAIVVDDLHVHGEKEGIYSTIKANWSSDDIILVETSTESTRKACEALAASMIEKIRSTFSSYDGASVSFNPHVDALRLASELDGEVPEDVKAGIVDALKNPSLLLQSLTLYTSRVNTIIHRETEKIDIRADSELLRYKYENGRVIDAASPDASCPLPYQVYGNGKMGTDLSTRGTYDQLLERQKAHVQQFVATEDALNKAAEAKSLCQKLLKRLYGNSDVVPLQTLPAGATSQSLGSLRHFELEVLAKEREVAGLRASLNTLTSEVERLNKLCIEWKEAEDSLKKKWKKIEEFDACRSELETISNALLRAIMDASAFWEQQPLAAREHASMTIIPACTGVMKYANSGKDLIEKELSAFYQSFDNSLYMLPATPQALLESMGVTGTGSEALAAAEKNAAMLTARAGAGDPSAIPSICRISAALQYNSGLDGADEGLSSVLESMDFCLKLCGSEANVLENLAKAINLVHTRRNLVENNRTLLNHTYRVHQEYDRLSNYCLKLSGEQEKVVADRWLPELRKAVLDGHKCLNDCHRVRGLVDEWWEQPAATAVDWVTVDGQNVGAWLNLVKQLQMAFYDQQLL